MSLISLASRFRALTATQALAPLWVCSAKCLTSSAGPVKEVEALLPAKAEATKRARTKKSFILIFDVSLQLNPALLSVCS